MKMKTPLILFLILTLAACSRFEKLKGAADQSSTAGDTTNTDTTDGTSPGPGGVIASSQKVNLPIAVLSVSQMLTSMLSATNMKPNNVIKGEYSGRYAMLADGNEIDLINPPLLLSATSVAAAICAESFDKEYNMENPADRYVFKSFDLSKSAKSLTDEEFAKGVREVARIFWSRNETAEELKYLQAYRTEFMADPTNEPLSKFRLWRNFGLSLCAAMLSSMEAITY